MKRLVMLLLAVLSITFLVGDDCEIDIEGFRWPRAYYGEVIYDEPPIFYDPGPVFLY